MKKIIQAFTILFSLLILIGCQEVEKKWEINNPKIPYLPQEAIENGDVVSLLGEISHVDNFENFIRNVHAKTEDEIRITMYTTEGDPIFYNLYFDGKMIQYGYDPSQDRFGDFGADTQITACSNLVSKTVEERVEYYLDACDDEIIGDTFHFSVAQD